MNLLRVVGVAITLLFVCMVSSHAQEFPAGPIKIIAPFPPGGATDLYARAVGDAFQRAWGQPAVVENRPGASGIIGAEYASKAAADGQTVLIGAASLHTILPLLNERMGLAQKNLVPVAMIGINPSYVIVPSALPVSNLKELITYVRAAPGAYSYASAGAGTSQHVFVELFKQTTKTFIVHIPYRGSGPMMTDLIAGRVILGIEQGPAALPQIRGGKIKALAVTSARRSIALPDVPTIAGSGLPGFEASTWFAVTAPLGTPSLVIAKMNAEIVKTFAAAEVRSRLIAAGVEPETSSPEALSERIRRDTEKWAVVVKASNIGLDN